MKDTSADNYDELFKAYVRICNKALDEHQDEFPYKQLCQATKSMLGNNSVKVAVYDDRPKECYGLQLVDNKISFSKESNDVAENGAWRINLSYLQQVVENPEKYIKHPAKLDWEWLRSRIGI